MFISRVKAQTKKCEYQDRKYGDGKRSKQERLNKIKAKLMWKPGGKQTHLSLKSTEDDLDEEV